ncbi:MAG: VIT1/CCC1 transporter family protein [Acidimicrobiales bacterium]|nr:VIT1/CCC1 transporter family protein [Acidimicrobiales bacterium]
MAPHRYDDHHRDVHNSGVRAAVFGASDGLVSNVLLIVGLAGADASAGVIRAAGVAGLLAGAISMAAGEYVSVRAQNDLVARELEKEKLALAEDPEEETEELAQVYIERGMSPEQAREMAQLVMQNPEMALEVHAREELGISPNELASPFGSAFWSFLAFAIGALLPLVPWFVSSSSTVIWFSVAAAVIGAAAIGSSLALATGHSVLRGVARHVGIAVAAAAAIHFVGVALGSAVDL